MSKVVLDASAMMAVVNDEVGSDEVLPYLKQGVMSAVNFSEAIHCLNRIAIPTPEARQIIKDLLVEIMPYDEEQACLTAEFKLMTKKKGLSLGDCACLALAKRLNVSVVTADKVWSQLDLKVKVILLR